MKNALQCFLNLAKTSYSKKHMTKLKHAEVSVTVNPKLTSGEMRHFYQQLYSSQGHTPAVLSNVFNFESLPKLDSVSKASVRVRLHDEECLFALKSFQRNKTPGMDGFWQSSIFVSGMRSPTSNLLIDCFNHGALFGRALHLPRQGIISLIPQTNILCFLKTGGLLYLFLQKHRLQTYNEMYRKTDRKSSSPSHRNRRDQAGYIKGRFKGENMRLFSDIIKQNGKEEGPE